MKAKDVKVGGYYVMKVSDRLTIVKVTGESVYGGWNAINLRSGREVRARSPQKFRREIDATEAMTWAGRQGGAR